ncbi:MAG TPA: tRNA lysidine(34) synthetase TilS [Verrucomicrobiae bacterium]
MSEFLQRVESEIHSRRLLLRGQKILVAVSGGADSMVLLHVLNSLAKKNRWKISVAHFNHQLRGRASEADEKLVRRTAKKLRLRFLTGRADVKESAVRSKISVEMAARKLRHEFFARTAREQKIFAVALAHHADDQVELFFLRLLRGTGGEGLAGMKWRSPSPAEKKISLVRPLLGFSKGEILAFARAKKTPFRDDATNFSADFLRNRIRNELLPLLQKNYQPGLAKTVLRLMEIVGAESEFVGSTAQAWLKKSRGVRGDETQIKKPAATACGHGEPAVGHPSEPLDGGGHEFGRLPVAVQRKALQLQLAGTGVVADFELVEQLRRSPDKFASISFGFSVARDMAGEIKMREQVENKFNAAELRLKLRDRSGRAEFGGKSFRWQIRPQKIFKLPPKRAGVGIFDADKIGAEIILRHWRAGDRFQPMGLNSPTKLQDLFVNAKIPEARRRNLVLAATVRGEIFWVEGLRIGEKFKLTPATNKRLRWRF